MSEMRADFWSAIESLTDIHLGFREPKDHILGNANKQSTY